MSFNTQQAQDVNLLTKLKKKVQQMLTSQAIAAHKIGLTPNKVSIIGFILAVASAGAYAMVPSYRWLLLLATVLLLASGFCDTLDGIIARTFQQVTVFGGFFDSVLDRYADAIVYSAIIIAGLCNPAWGTVWGPVWALATLAGSLLVSYSRARAEAAGIKMESIGIAERAERMLILSRGQHNRVFLATSLGLWYSLVSGTFKLYRYTKSISRLRGIKEKNSISCLVSSFGP